MWNSVWHFYSWLSRKFLPERRSLWYTELIITVSDKELTVVVNLIPRIGIVVGKLRRRLDKHSGFIIFVKHSIIKIFQKKCLTWHRKLLRPCFVLARFSVESSPYLFNSKWSYVKLGHGLSTCNECLTFTQCTKSVLYCEKPFTFYANTTSVERKLESQRTRTHQCTDITCVCVERFIIQSMMWIVDKQVH